MQMEKVRQFIVNNFLFGEASGLRDETSFLEEGIVDSTGMLELIVFLEESFHISVEDEELVPENLDSLQNIARFLERKLEHAEPRTSDTVCSEPREMT